MQKRSDFILPGLSIAFAAIFAASTAAAQTSEPPKSETDAAQSSVPQNTQGTSNQGTTNQGTTTQGANTGTTTDAAASQKKSWSDLDTDKDGNLSKTEAAPIPSLQAVFDQADANADGALSGEEYKTYLAVNGQPSPAKPKK